MRRIAATSLGGVSEVVGEVVHVCDVTSELKYVVVCGVAGLLFLFYFIIRFWYFLLFILFLRVVLFNLRIIMQTSILDRE
jgi:hypothetical protein